MEPDEPTLEERLERALDLLAYLIKTYGRDHAPLFERLEHELAELRRGGPTVEERAARYVAVHGPPPFEQKTGSDPKSPKGSA